MTKMTVQIPAKNAVADPFSIVCPHCKGAVPVSLDVNTAAHTIEIDLPDQITELLERPDV